MISKLGDIFWQLWQWDHVMPLDLTFDSSKGGEFLDDDRRHSDDFLQTEIGKALSGTVAFRAVLAPRRPPRLSKSR